MTYPEFEARWRPAGGPSAPTTAFSCKTSATCSACPAPTTDNPSQDQYVLERAVEFRDGAMKSTGRIDLYKRACFVLLVATLDEEGMLGPQAKAWVVYGRCCFSLY